MAESECCAAPGRGLCDMCAAGQYYACRYRPGAPREPVQGEGLLQQVAEHRAAALGDVLTAVNEFAAKVQAIAAKADEARPEGEGFALIARTAETLDAERYRYLRNAAGQYMGEEDGPSVCSGLSDLFEYHFGPEVDEVVDEAIAKWKAQGCPLPPAAIAELK